jgi:hypothetical protein
MCGPLAAATAARYPHEGRIRVRAVTASGSNALPRLQGTVPPSGTRAQELQDRSWHSAGLGVCGPPQTPPSECGHRRQAAKTQAATATLSLVEFPLPRRGN